MRSFVLALAVAFSSIALPSAFAEDRLRVRPGMSLSQVTEILKPKCLDYVVGGTSEKYVTCVMGEGLTPAVVTATISRKDRTYYIQWRDLVGPDLPVDYARVAAREMGFSAERPDCVIYARPRTCWSDGAGTLLYDAGYESKSGLQIYYLDNDSIRKADAN